MIEFSLSKIGFCSHKDEFYLDDIPLIGRRRMSMAFKAAYTAMKDFSEVDMPIVFASNLGEINRCTDLLKELGKFALVSPASFSLSVLNSTPCNIAIKRSIHSQIDAISAEACVENAVISAFSKLQSQICLICYEESFETDEFFCVCMVMKKGDDIKLQVLPSQSKKSIKSIENFVENFGKNFSYDDGANLYKWEFSDSF